MTVIVAPDVELWGCTWLRQALAARPEPCASGVVVHHIVLKPIPDRFVQVRHDGGIRQDLLHDSQRLTVNVWGHSVGETDEQDTIDLARLTEGLLLSVRGVDPVEMIASSAGVSTVPDSRPHRMFTVDVTTRGVAS